MKKIIALTLALLMSFSCFSLISFAEETDTVEHLTEVPEGYVGVYTIEDLYCVRNDLSANYILMNDIDLTEATAKGGDWSFDGRGWNPIGSNDVYGASSFDGVFDGNGYAVKGIKIDISKLPSGTKDIYVGLFSYVSGTIRNLTIDGSINVKLSIINDIYVGGISAYLYKGTIENSVSKVKISVSNEKIPSSHSDAYDVFAGGISGLSNYATIVRCKNLIDINSSVYKGYNGYNPNASHTTSDSEAYTGGICAYQSSSTIYNCYNVGTINAQGKSSYCRSYASGIANYGSIDNSYNLGEIETSSYSAGIGYSATCKYCYNMGLTDGYAISNREAVKCYYLVDSGNVYTGASSLTESQMKLKALYQNWDFDTVWTMSGREDYPYPELRDVALVLPDDPDHKHEYTSQITTTPTHIEKGILTYTCDCGDTYTETIEKIAEHNYIAEITTPATHMAEGILTFTCDCGDTYTEVIKKITAHNFEATVTEPTCTEHGFTTFTCECGETYTRDYVSAIGHKHTATITDPTCSEEGFTTYTCECGDSYVDNYVDATGHIDEDGDYICDNDCGYEFEKTEPETPDEPENNEEEKPCDCNCHKGGITAFLFKLINFFAKLFDSSAKTCKCGAKH